MSDIKRKIGKSRPKLPVTSRESLNVTEWEHRVTDSGDYNGTEKIPRNSGDYEITTDYRRVPESHTEKNEESTQKDSTEKDSTEK